MSQYKNQDISDMFFTSPHLVTNNKFILLQATTDPNKILTLEQNNDKTTIDEYDVGEIAKPLIPQDEQ